MQILSQMAMVLTILIGLVAIVAADTLAVEAGDAAYDTRAARMQQAARRQHAVRDLFGRRSKHASRACDLATWSPRAHTRAARTTAAEKEVVSIVHLHIPKTGGSSLDDAVSALLKNSVGYNYINNLKLSESGAPPPRLAAGAWQRPAGGRRRPRRTDSNHFDWSHPVVQQTASTSNNKDHDNSKLVMLLRHPVDRMVSAFSFAQRSRRDLKDVAAGGPKRFSDMTAEAFFNDPALMMALPHIWRDGGGGIFYLTGLSEEHQCLLPECDQAAARANAYLHPRTVGRERRFAQLPKSDLLAALQQQDGQRPNMSGLLSVAAARLGSVAWLGCLGYRVNDSIDQLSSMLGVGKIAFPHNSRSDKNVGHVDHSGGRARVSNATRARLARMVPYDLALYNYAKQLTDFRLGCGSLPRPQPPTVPREAGCKVTSTRLQCPVSVWQRNESSGGRESDAPQANPPRGIDYTRHYMGMLNHWPLPPELIQMSNELVPPLLE